MKLKSSVWTTTIAIVTVWSATYAQHAGGQSNPSPSGARGSDSREFVDQMTIVGLAEVQLGKLAAERSANPEVKAFGRMMVKDHSQANADLARVAAQLGVKPPEQLDEKHRELAEKLSKLQGAEFDREYMTAMVQGHEEVASKLRTRAEGRLTSGQPGAGSTPPKSGSAPTTGSASVGTTGSGRGEQALTQWATKALPTVQRHLERARELQQKVK